jgi:predicted Zn-dependent peptidase
VKYKFFEFDLDNGIHVIFLKYPGVYSGAIDLRFLGGYLAEAPNRRGHLHLYEHAIHHGNVNFQLNVT